MLGQVVTIGVIVAFLGYVSRFFQPITQIAQLWTSIQSALAGAERVFELLDEKPDIVDAPDAAVLPPVKGGWSSVTFPSATMMRSAGRIEGECVVRHVNLIAEPGQVVALVGPTGAGKTTLVNLIPRFYDVTAGAVLVDGHDVRQVTQESLRRQIGVVLQDTFLFSTTVRENIRYGRPDASDEEVEAAAHISSAHEFIQRLPKGYETMLGERGQQPQPGSAAAHGHRPRRAGEPAHPDSG